MRKITGYLPRCGGNFLLLHTARLPDKIFALYFQRKPLTYPYLCLSKSSRSCKQWYQWPWSRNSWLIMSYQHNNILDQHAHNSISTGSAFKPFSPSDFYIVSQESFTAGFAESSGILHVPFSLTAPATFFLAHIIHRSWRLHSCSFSFKNFFIWTSPLFIPTVNNISYANYGILCKNINFVRNISISVII